MEKIDQFFNYYNYYYYSAHDNTAKLWRLCEDGSAICLTNASGHTHSVGSIILTQGTYVYRGEGEWIE